MQCFWNFCGLEFEDPLILEDHAIDHVAQEGSSTSRIQCQWNSCNYPPRPFNVNVATLIRHIRFHVFVEMLRYHSVDLLHNMKIMPTCSSKNSPKLHHILSHLQCGWTDCNFVTNSFINLDEHLIDIHSENESCRWNSCSNAKLSIDHLREHAGLASFACPSCLSLFSTSENYLQHESALQPPVRLEQNFVCEWLTCNAEEFTSYTELHRHCMMSHLTSTETCVCLWRGCPASKLDELSMLQKKRHLLLHAFAESCRQAAVFRIRKHCANIDACSVNIKGKRTDWFKREFSSTGSDSVIFHGFQCLWYDCGQRTDVASFLMQHVQKHGQEEKEEEKNIEFVCRWLLRRPSQDVVVCNSRFAKVTELKSHLTRHTGLPCLLCPACQRVFYTPRAFLSHLCHMEKFQKEKMIKKRKSRAPIPSLKIIRANCPLLPKPIPPHDAAKSSQLVTTSEPSVKMNGDNQFLQPGILQMITRQPFDASESI